jgi:hypothetical protein
MAWIKVVRGDGRGNGNKVYVGGNRVQSFCTIGQTIQSPTGTYTFVTLDQNDDPDWKRTANLVTPPGDDQDDPIIVILQPAAQA